MGSDNVKENKAEGDKSRSKTRESGKSGVPKADAAGIANGGNNVSKDVTGPDSSVSGSQAPLVSWVPWSTWCPGWSDQIRP